MHLYQAKHTLEIFSGSLLAKRKRWQPVKEHLPAPTYLLVTPLANPTRTRWMLELGRALRAAGQSVVVLSVG